MLARRPGHDSTLVQDRSSHHTPSVDLFILHRSRRSEGRPPHMMARALQIAWLYEGSRTDPA